MNQKRLKAIDLFAGCGGLTQGLKLAGFEIAAAVEIDPLAADTYALNHKRVRLFRQDIREVEPKELMGELGFRKGELDLLSGCPPCQGFSRLRTLNGGREVEDSRNNLIFELCRFVSAFRPRALMFENVPGIEKTALFDVLLRRLRGAGYRCRWTIANAADYWVPQRRRRFILLAGLGRHIDFPLAQDRRKTVRQAIGRLPTAGSSGDLVHDVGETRSKVVERLISRIPANGGSIRDLGEEALLDCHKRCGGFRDVYGRMAWSSVSPTITSGCVNPSKGRFLHPEEDRCITLREAAMLQSFPRRYKFSLRRGKFPAAEMIGNAFPPEFARRYAAAVASELNLS